MIICFGSLNADLIYRVQDAPQSGQTVAALGFSMEAGGKGANQAIAAARDGARVLMAGAVGRDALADVALANFAAAGVDTDRIARVDAPTGNAAILVDAQGRNRITVAEGANALASQTVLRDDDLRAARLVLLQMETPLAQTRALLARCRAQGVRTVLNLAPAMALDRETLALVSLLVVNEDEADTLAAALHCDGTAPSLARLLGIDVIRTLGAEGAEAFAGGEHVTVPAHPVTAVDTTAAGDCFIGVLAAALDRGRDLRAAMRRASAAAALCCTVRGSQTSLPAVRAIDTFEGEITRCAGG